MKDDEKIESFFKKMKEADERIVVPAFPVQQEPAKRRMTPVFIYAAAAMVAVLVVSIFLVRPQRNDEQVNKEIVIEVGPDLLKSNSLLEQQSLAEWESPTDFLSEDF